jgi:hypothetical protein
MSIEAAVHVGIEATSTTKAASASVPAPSSSAKSSVEVVLREEAVLITKWHHRCHGRVETTHSHHGWVEGIGIHHVCTWMYE